MSIGVMILLAAAVYAGNWARRDYANFADRPLKFPSVFAAVIAIIGALLDAFSGPWVSGIASGAGLIIVYGCVAQYLLRAVYYRRVIPLVIRSSNKRRRRP